MKSAFAIQRQGRLGRRRFKHRQAKDVHIVGIFLARVTRAIGRLTAVQLILEDLTGVLLGLFGGVGVVKVGLVATGDVSCVGHFGD